MDGRKTAEARHRLAEEIEDLMLAEEYDNVFEVAWALVDAIETAALGLIAAKVIEMGRADGSRSEPLSRPECARARGREAFTSDAHMGGSGEGRHEMGRAMERSGK